MIARLTERAGFVFMFEVVINRVPTDAHEQTPLQGVSVLHPNCHVLRHRPTPPHPDRKVNKTMQGTFDPGRWLYIRRRQYLPLDKSLKPSYHTLIMLTLTTKPVIEATRKGFWHGFALNCQDYHKAP